MLELVLSDRTRVPLVHDLTIGRSPDNALQLEDPAVSRRQARILVSAKDGAARVEDVGSTFGTWVDGRRLDGVPVPLTDGSRIRMGSHELLVERLRGESEAGRTVVVEPGASLVAPAAAEPGGRFGTHPRPRSGYALKRLEASEGDERWVLRDLESDRFLRMSDADARLFELLDGRRSLSALVHESKGLEGPAGPLRLGGLLAELAARGRLAGVEPEETTGQARSAGVARRLSSWQRTWDGAGDFFERLYRRGAWRIFT